MPAPTVREGIWRLADPKISLASFSGMALGAAAAAVDGPIAWGWLGLTVAGSFAIEVAKNASGEVVDFDHGVDQAVTEADRSPFSGGKRVLVERLLTRGETVGIAWVSYAVGIMAGLLIVAAREPGVLWIGVAGVGLAYFYHAAPFRLSYRGLGEVAVAVVYGPLVCAGTYLVQRGTVSSDVLWLSLPLALLIGGFLLINEFPDYLADQSAGKRTLVVRLGRRRASRAFAGIVLVTSLLMVLLPLILVPRGALLGAFAILPATAASRTLLATPEETRRIIPAQVRTLQSFVLYAVAAGAGLLLF
ncbi:MAG: prenyltransferase [Gemmatimonadota bacterium]|nr:prenyltransferase [Gemmatimonadota bacterium]